MIAGWHILTRAVALLPLLAGPAAAQSAALLGESWDVYANPRFGVRVDYPAVFGVKDPPPENGDGQTFRIRRGEAELWVFGGHKIDDENAARMMAACKRPGTHYSLERAAKGWFVLSGRWGETITYLRCALGDSVFGCADLTYPASEAERWKPMVERISRSLALSPLR